MVKVSSALMNRCIGQTFLAQELFALEGSVGQQAVAAHSRPGSKTFDKAVYWSAKLTSSGKSYQIGRMRGWLWEIGRAHV